MASPNTVYSDLIFRAPTQVHNRSPVVTPMQTRCERSLIRFCMGAWEVLVIVPIVAIAQDLTRCVLVNASQQTCSSQEPCVITY